MLTDEQKAAAYDGVVAEREDLKGKLKNANDEAKGHRLSAEAYRTEVADVRGQLKTANESIETLKGEHKTAIEKLDIDHKAQKTALEAERDGAKTAANERIVDADLRLAAKDMGIVDMEALKLLDKKGLKLDDAGNVTNASELLEAMKESKPYLFGTPPAAGTTTGTTASTARKPAPATTKDTFDARTAKPEEVEAKLAELTRPRYA